MFNSTLKWSFFQPRCKFITIADFIHDSRTRRIINTILIIVLKDFGTKIGTLSVKNLHKETEIQMQCSQN